MKKEVNMFLIISILFIVLTGFISADSCSIETRSSCNDYIVMGLSSSTNAHGEFPDIGTYDYVLCCDFGAGDTECTGANKLIGLSSSTNAHAETPYPVQPNYDLDVCYIGLTCVNVGTCNTDYPLEILSLSAWTNAHIGAYSDYDVKICCKHLECREEVNYCSDYIEEECNIDPCGVASESVETTNPDITCDEGYSCQCEWSSGKCNSIWEETDEPQCGDDRIDSELGETCDGTTLPYTDCSGNVDACTEGSVSCYPPGHENECTLNISACTGCVEGGICGDNIINNLYETCDNESLNSKTCESFGLCGEGLACYSSGFANNCTFDTTGCEPCDSHPSKIGKCTYDEATNDTCDDGFLTYSWEGNWVWDSENIFDTNPDGENYVLGSDGKWHYDPNGASEKCVDGGNTVPCPAQIQLPFFGPYNIILISSLIALIYMILIWKKKKTISKRRVKKK